MGLDIDQVCMSADRRRMDSEGLAGRTVEGIEIRAESEVAEEVGRLTSKKGGHC